MQWNGSSKWSSIHKCLLGFWVLEIPAIIQLLIHVLFYKIHNVIVECKNMWSHIFIFCSSCNSGDLYNMCCSGLKIVNYAFILCAYKGWKTIMSTNDVFGIK